MAGFFFWGDRAPNVKIIIIINKYIYLCEHNLFNGAVLIAEINAYYYYLYLNVRVGGGGGGRCPPMLKY